LIECILEKCKVIAVVGFSSNPLKPSHQVPRYLLEHGFQVIPVNPNAEEILGLKSYPSLRDVPVKVDVVEVFRPPEEAVEIVKDAIAIGARVVWFQEGIVNREAAKMGEEAGLKVVMDRCMKKEYQLRYGGD